MNFVGVFLGKEKSNGGSSHLSLVVSIFSLILELSFFFLLWTGIFVAAFYFIGMYLWGL